MSSDDLPVNATDQTPISMSKVFFASPESRFRFFAQTDFAFIVLLLLLLPTERVDLMIIAACCADDDVDDDIGDKNVNVVVVVDSGGNLLSAGLEICKLLAHSTQV